MISSKYKIYQVVLIILVFLLCILGGIGILQKEKAVSFKSILGVSALLLLAFYMIISFFYKSPKIILSTDSITVKRLFKTSVYSWDQVTNVLLSSKEYYSAFIILRRTFAAMKLIFSDGKSLIFWEDMYRNMNEMREMVTERLNDKIHFMKKKEDRYVYDLINKIYAGNVWTSINTLLIAGIAIFFVLELRIKEGGAVLVLIPFFFVLLLYILFGTQMNFFEIKYGKLIIRNHYFPWKSKKYDLNDIEEVSTETPYRRSTGLRIITYQFESKFFGAGSLRSHTWNDLLKDLSSMGIKTKND